MALEEPVSHLAPDEASEFAELWGHHDDLQAVCTRMVGNATDAEDVVQETYLRALVARRRLDRRDSFGPWLATVARRRAIDEIRWQRRARAERFIVEAPPGSSLADDPADQVVQQEVLDRLRVALGELSSRERQLLLRQVSHGLSLAELAEEEDTSIASVRSVLSRARGKLRSALERGGPLGVAPLPRLVAAVRSRVHKVAGKLEGLVPSLTAGGAHLGDVVGAAIAAAALLLGGSPTVPSSSAEVVTMSHAPAILASMATDASRPGGRAAAPAETMVRANAETMAPAPPPVLPADIDIPNVADDGASQPELSLVTSLSASSDGTTLFASGKSRTGGTYTVYRSSDSGRSWHRLEAAGFLDGRIIVPPTYPSQRTLFSVGEAVLQQSDDGGDEWLSVAPARWAAALSPDYAAGDHRVILATPQLLAYDADSHLVLPITAHVRTGHPRSLALLPSFLSDGAVLVGAQVSQDATAFRPTGGVYRCTVAGCDDPVALPHTMLGPDLVVTSRAIYAWSANLVYRSVDGGRSFVRVAIPAGLSVTRILETQPGEIMLGALMQNSTAQPRLLRSTDDGRSWTPVGAGTALDSGVYDFVRLATGSIVAGVQSGGVVCSSDAGATWHRRCD